MQSSFSVVSRNIGLRGSFGEFSFQLPILPRNLEALRSGKYPFSFLLFHKYTLCPLLLEMYFSLSLFKKASKDMGVLASNCVVYSLRRSRTFVRAVQLSALLNCTLQCINGRFQFILYFRSSLLFLIQRYHYILVSALT